MNPGPELDERVARLLGWEPKRVRYCWEIVRRGKPVELSAEGPADRELIISMNRDEVIRTYEELVYPPASTDPAAMIRALEAMRERGWAMSIGLSLLDYIVEAMDPQGDSVRRVGDTLMHAVALAIVAALEGEDAR